MSERESTNEEILDDIGDTFLDLLHEGETPDIDSILRRHPDLDATTSEELRRKLRFILRMFTSKP